MLRFPILTDNDILKSILKTKRNTEYEPDMGLNLVLHFAR